jgi:hypothetical protein
LTGLNGKEVTYSKNEDAVKRYIAEGAINNGIIRE